MVIPIPDREREAVLIAPVEFWYNHSKSENAHPPRCIHRTARCRGRIRLRSVRGSW
jgi:hypothetical protein